tara:strand:- start:2639 stop:3181 length:543 start_codon:yes stop_codon:yes gene_type:complete
MSVQKETFSTPVGTARYPWLKEPDTAFGQQAYKCMLILSPTDAQPIITKIEAMKALFGAKADKAMLPYEEDAETGDIILKTKTTFEPLFFDSQGNPVVSGSLPDIWGGSQLKLGGMISPWNKNGKMGITLQLGKVMIVEAKGPTGGGGSVDSGFEAVEGGFVMEEGATFEEPSSDAPSYL